VRRDEALKRALRWAQQGVPTFPLRYAPGSDLDKTPLTSHGHTDATVDPSKLKNLFKPWKDDEVRVGVYLGPGGYMAWDIDVKDGKPGEASLAALTEEYPELDDVLRVAHLRKTPSGGAHFITYKPFDENHVLASIANDNGTRLGRGIDIRADGGYIADCDEYEWVRGDIETLSTTSQTPSTLLERFTMLGESGARGLTADDWEKLTPEDRAVYEWMVKHGTAHSPVIKSGGASGNGVYIMLAHEGRTSRGCAIGGATNPGRVMIFSEGWELDNGQHLPGEPNPYELAELENVYATGSRTGQVQLVTLRQEPNSTKSLAERFRAELYDIDTLSRIEPPEFLVGDFLVRDSLAELFADPGVGKSFLAIDWMMHIADGRDWHGRQVKKPEPVFYIIGEGRGGVKSRVAAWQQHHGTSDAIKRNVKLLGMPVNLSRAEHVEAIMPILKEQMPALIVIDTLARASTAADGNSDKDMGIVIEHADQIRRETGACVLVVHHSGHQNKDRGRGSSAIAAALQTDLRLTKNGEKLTLTTTKQKDHREADAHSMYIKEVWLTPEESSLVIVPLSTSGDGEEVSSEEPEWLSQKLGDLYRALLNKTQDPLAPISRGSWLEGVDGFDSNNMFQNYKAKLMTMGVVGQVGGGRTTMYYAIPLQKEPPKENVLTVNMSDKEAKAGGK